MPKFKAFTRLNALLSAVSCYALYHIHWSALNTEVEGRHPPVLSSTPPHTHPPLKVVGTACSNTLYVLKTVRSRERQCGSRLTITPTGFAHIRTCHQVPAVSSIVRYGLIKEPGEYWMLNPEPLFVWERRGALLYIRRI